MTNPRTILIADDDPDARGLLRQILCLLATARGLSIAEAFNGLEALERASSLRPELMILDNAMPGLDGLSVCRELKKSPATRHIPVIMLSGSAIEAEALAAGAEAFMAKPFDVVLLLDLVTACLDGRNSRQE